MVTEPFFSSVVLGKTLSESTKWTMLGGMDSTMHTHVIISAFEEQEDMFLTSGASVGTIHVFTV